MEERVLTVSAINNYIKSLLDNNIYFQSFLIEGEISNFKNHYSSGHLYFSLKDNKSQINCVMFSSSAKTLNFLPKNGNKVILRGRLSSYPAAGTYQIYVSRMKLSGIGDLYLKFEKLKKELNALGYFREDRKKKIPRFVKSIGVITSETGAVIRDIIKTINKRYNKARLILYPTKVQGEGAENLIAMSIAKANQDGLVDVIILARGGGSMEDLWPFNERVVADAIYNSKIPIISAVGHETDFTISDYVADLRSPTPTAAGTYVVPDKESLFKEVDSYLRYLAKIYLSKMTEFNMHVLNLNKRLDSLKPEDILLRKKKEVMQMLGTLNLLYQKSLASKDKKIANLKANLETKNPTNIIKLKREELTKLFNILKHNYKSLITDKKQQYLLLNTKLDSLNPLKVMAKGFSLASINNKYIRSIKDVKKDDVIETILKDGTIISQVKGVK